MNETTRPDSASDVPWLTSDRRMPVAGTSMLPGSEQPPAAAAGLLKHAVQGAHDGIDRLAGRAAPVVRQLGDGAAAAAAALEAKAGQLRDTRDAWAEGARSTVRSHPLAALAAALALGLVLARIARIGR